MKVVIKMTGHGIGDIYIDGILQENVCEVDFKAVAGGSNTVGLRFLAEDVEIESEETEYK